MQNKYQFKKKIRKAKPSYTCRRLYDNTLAGGSERKSDIDRNRVIPGRASKG